MDEHMTALAWHGEAGLGLEIEMGLSCGGHRAVDHDTPFAVDRRLRPIAQGRPCERALGPRDSADVHGIWGAVPHDPTRVCSCLVDRYDGTSNNALFGDRSVDH